MHGRLDDTPPVGSYSVNKPWLKPQYSRAKDVARPFLTTEKRFPEPQPESESDEEPEPIRSGAASLFRERSMARRRMTSAPFASTTRRIDARPSTPDDGPGPGSYSVDPRTAWTRESYNRMADWAGRGMLASGGERQGPGAAEADSMPGPGSYSPPSRWGKQPSPGFDEWHAAEGQHRRRPLGDSAVRARQMSMNVWVCVCVFSSAGITMK